MPKKENLEFLISLYSNSVKNNRKESNTDLDVYEALLKWLFGDERTIEVCARTAYRDVQRNLIGIGDDEVPQEKKQAWKEEIEKKITQCIEELFIQNISEQKEFDTWHKKTCEEICKISDKHNISKYLKNGFTDGIAQKQLNMTIKNMFVMDMEKWNEDLNKIKKYLHIPVDSYILQAASEKLGIEIINKKGKYSPYKGDVSKPWSKWNYDDYIKFQEDVRKAIAYPIADCPMDWEFSAWNETKAKRENK